MPAFLAKIMAANQNSICGAAMGTVSKLTVKSVLLSKLTIPLFQRRYCWGQPQWQTLLTDTAAVAAGRKMSHDLGRLTVCFDEASGRNLVIDGQQRNTTLALLLSAIRDEAYRRVEGEEEVDEDQAVRYRKMDRAITNILCPDKPGYEAWLSEQKADVFIGAGEVREPNHNL